MRHFFLPLSTTLFSIINAISLPQTPRDEVLPWSDTLLPGEDVPGSLFLPFFVPSGDQLVDDTSDLISYSPLFQMQKLSTCVNNTHHFARANGDTATFAFEGDRVEWFGKMSPEHGIASVYIDGSFVASIDSFSPTPLDQQRLFSVYDLTPGGHSLLINVTGHRHPRARDSLIDVDAFVIRSPTQILKRGDVARSVDAAWSLIQKGTTEVAAMQLAVVSDTHAIIIDKVEHNRLSIDGHPAWAALYDLRSNEVRPLTMKSNSFCAGGAWLSNGTLLNIGGNPIVADHTGAADFGDVNGLQAVRMFNPCDNGRCDMKEAPERVRLASARWYNTVTRLDDGSVMVIGGSLKGGWMNNKTTNNPTIEYFPPKNIHGRNGLPISSPFLEDTLNSNLFPIAFTLPDGRVFIAANNDAMVYDWRKNTELRLPRIPNGVRVTYPMTGTGILLPLSSKTAYTPEVLICGGSNVDDKRAGYDISSQETASDQCSRIVLSEAGIKEGWKVERMPEARIMPDAVMLPDGKIVIVNGGRTGIAGYGNVKQQVGQSNAANPVFSPVLYDPLAPAGKRFSRQDMPSSKIPRLYHSVATLTPDGSIMIAGSNPNLDRSNVEFGTEYRVEWLRPPYVSLPRPSLRGLPAKISYGKSFTVQTNGIPANKEIQVSLMDLGYVTHAVHMNARLVVLDSYLSSDRKLLSITGPPKPGIYPPGPAWIYVVVDGVPSYGKKIMVGSGEGPVVDQAAIDNLLLQSSVVKGSTSSTNTEGR